MRAIVVEKNDLISVGSTFQYKGEYLQHLINVSRVKTSEKLMLLDGLGSRWVGEVIKVEKKLIEVFIEKLESFKLEKREVAFCLVKKDSLEIVLKTAVELGCSKITILYSDFSQRYNLNLDRVRKIINSALMQSNNPFRPEVEMVKNINQFLSNRSKDLIVLSSSENVEKKEEVNLNTKGKVLLVGPEGGFSEKEEALMTNLNLTKIHFDLPILRTNTALSFGLGFIKS